jgi:hypothetical protein
MAALLDVLRLAGLPLVVTGVLGLAVDLSTRRPR